MRKQKYADPYPTSRGAEGYPPLNKLSFFYSLHLIIPFRQLTRINYKTFISPDYIHY